MLNQKGFAPILIVLVVVLVMAAIGGAYYFGTQKNTQLGYTNQTFTPKPVASAADPTSNWKTFTGPNFTLKLPTEWKDVSVGNTNSYLNYEPPATGGDGFNKDIDKGKLKAEIHTTDKPMTLDQFLTNEKISYQDALGSKDINWDETPIKLDGQAAVKVKTGNPGFVVYTIHPTSKKGLSIGLGLDFDSYNQLANQILSTFKFTASAIQTKVPADAQTPAAGACGGSSTDSIVVVTLGADNVPNPRCTKVTVNQSLQIINSSNQTIQGTVGSYTINIDPGKSQTLDASFGSYLLPGVHRIAGAEIWLQ